MADILSLSAHLPEVELAPGEVVVTEGGPGGAIWVLVSGALRVRKGEVPVNTITRPGAAIGEMSVLLGTRNAATVEATEPSRLRYAADGDALLSSDPTIARLVAVGAGRAAQVRHDLPGRPEDPVRGRPRALHGLRRAQRAGPAGRPDRPAGIGPRP